MHSTFALAAFAAVAYASPVPQEFSSELAPEASAPSGCSASYSGKFQIAAVNVTSSSKRDLETRQTSCTAPGSLTLALADGTLTDALNRIGYVASNYQFQFDAPPQAGTIYNTGFSACSNNTLALGGSSIFYQCLSGEFYNLYDRNWAPQCNAIYLQILPCGGATAPANGVGQVPDGQVTGTSVGAAPVTQIGDGQPQASTGLATVTQIGDGQIQAPTSVAAPVTQIGDGQIQAPTGVAPVTQIGDGQIQAPTGKPVAPVTQIGDGQIQAPTGSASVAPITQIGDGQIQAPTGTPVAPITQISDGQIQAPTGTPVAPITQISDGQIQAPTATSVVTPATTSIIAPVTQIGDGQIQAPTGTPTPSTTLIPVTQIGDGQVQAPAGTGSAGAPNASSTVIPFTGGASSNVVLSSGFAAMVLAAAGALLL